VFTPCKKSIFIEFCSLNSNIPKRPCCSAIALPIYCFGRQWRVEADKEIIYELWALASLKLALA
jgi:hypothetical protein